MQRHRLTMIFLVLAELGLAYNVGRGEDRPALSDPHLSPNETAAVAEFVVAVMTKRESVVRRAANRLRKIQGGKQVIPLAVIGLLHSDDVDIRRLALSATNMVGYSPELILPVLMESLSDPDASVRCCAVNEIGTSSDYVSCAKDSLVTALDDRSELVRIASCSALEQIQTIDSVSLAKLRAVSVSDLNEDVRVGAAVAITALDDQGNTDLLVESLVTGLRRESTRLTALRGLCRLGPRASRATCDLLPFVEKADSHDPLSCVYAIGAIETLRKIGPDAKVSIPALMKIACEQGCVVGNSRLKLLARRAIHEIDPSFEIPAWN